MSAPTVILGAWEHPRGDIGPDRIELDVIKRTVRRENRALFFGPQLFRFATAVIVAAPRMVEHYDLDEALFGDRADGGPENIRKTFQVFSHHMRRTLPVLGVELKTVFGWGYRAHFSDLPPLTLPAGANPPQARARRALRASAFFRSPSAGACLP